MADLNQSSVVGVQSSDKAAGDRRVLLIVSGGIAAYKALELVRLLQRDGFDVTAVLTEAGAHFVTPLSLQALTGNRVFTDLWSLTDENEMGHIELSRAADLIVVAPATADLIARHAAGLANDLATTVLLATDTPVLMAPAMNVRMWQHPATAQNVATLTARGISFIGPNDGEMACHEHGPGRLAEPPAILAAIKTWFSDAAAAGPLSLAGRHVLVTAGPTQEPIDAVRYIANRSSGRQGFAIASALALVAGPVALADPPGVDVKRVETACEMLDACLAALPADAAICAAAVADWRLAAPTAEKLKKADGPPVLDLVPNPDILAQLAAPGPHRPKLVVGFAAETDNLAENSADKRRRKGCDWIVANDVRPETGIMGGARNTVHILDQAGEVAWPDLPKEEVARRLAARIAAALRA
jgi:phosphopantothenoylcysteine decarboxylase/phosphopantothenate--cysteine ligase